MRGGATSVQNHDDTHARPSPVALDPLPSRCLQTGGWEVARDPATRDGPAGSIEDKVKLKVQEKNKKAKETGMMNTAESHEPASTGSEPLEHWTLFTKRHARPVKGRDRLGSVSKNLINELRPPVRLPIEIEIGHFPHSPLYLCLQPSLKIFTSN